MRRKTRLACVSETRAFLREMPKAMGCSLAVASVAALAASLTIAGFGEPVSDRTILLTLIIAAGAFMATAFSAFMALGLGALQNRWLSAALGGLWTGAGFIPATLLSFAIQNRLIEGRIETDTILDLNFDHIFWSMFGAMGMFTPTGLRYLMPWPLIGVTLAAACLFFLWPRPATLLSGVAS